VKGHFYCPSTHAARAQPIQLRVGCSVITHDQVKASGERRRQSKPNGISNPTSIKACSKRSAKLIIVVDCQAMHTVSRRGSPVAQYCRKSRWLLPARHLLLDPSARKSSRFYIYSSIESHTTRRKEERVYASIILLVEILASVNANVHSEYISILMRINSVPETSSKHELPLRWSRH